MSDEQTVSGKFQKVRQNFGNVRRIRHHFVGYPRQLHYFLAYLHVGIYKRLVNVEHFALFEKYRTYFRYCAVLYGKTCRLYVKYAERVIFYIRIFIPEYSRCGVVDEIRFHTVYYLEVCLCLFGGGHYFGERLEISVVGDGDCLVTEPRYGLYDVLGREGGVHCGKSGVKMELHTLFLGIIGAHYPLYHGYAERLYNERIVELVHLQSASQHYGSAVFDLFVFLVHVRVIYEFYNCRSVVVRNIERDYVIFPAFCQLFLI